MVVIQPLSTSLIKPNYRVINNQHSILSQTSKIFGVVQSIAQLLGNKDILNGVEFSTIPEQNQGLLGGTQNIRQIANVGESRYGAHFTGLTSTMLNGQMSGKELNESGKTLPFSGRLSKLKGRVAQ